MGRTEFIRLLVLSLISDDYQNVDQIILSSCPRQPMPERDAA